MKGERQLERRRPKILLVSGDLELVERVKAGFFELQWELLVAADDSAALARAMTEQPDVILVDQVIPGIESLAVCKTLKAGEETQDIPILVLTPPDESSAVIEALEAGAHDVLAQPFLLPALLSRVRAALRVKFLMDELKQKVNQLKDAAQRLQELALTDELTGLRNRRYLLDRLEEEIARARRHGYNVAYLLADIDDFKLINDQYGLPAGDRVLQGFANFLKAQTRREDVVGRYGSEEFGAIPMINEGWGAIAYAQRLCANLAKQAFSLNGKTVRLTASVGLVVRPGGEIEQKELLLQAADVALHRAKAEGKNRVVIYPT